MWRTTSSLPELLRKLPAWAALAALGAGLLATGHALEAGAADPVVPVVIKGSGDSDILAQLVTWKNALFGADQPVQLDYFQRGSREGRDRLLSGAIDFTVGGVPFTAAERAAHPDLADKIIEVPLTVGSTAIAFTTPSVGWTTSVPAENCDANDPDYDPDTCQPTIGTYTDPIRIPPENLSAMITGLTPQFGGNNLISWGHPDLRAALNNAPLVIGGKYHTFVNRTEGASQNMYMMQYAKEMGPAAWDLRKLEYSAFTWEPIGEVFPPRTLSRFGAETQMGIMAISTVDAATNATPESWSGNSGPVPTTYVSKLMATFPAARFRVAEIKNKHGDWVAPTRESLDLALAAGVTPNFAAVNDVPGGYPIVYINKIFTVAGTLDPDQANALAASVRYIATDGQAQMIADGGTTITQELRSEALAGADEIVARNCTAAGFEVTVSGPSAFEPKTPQVQALTSLKHCTAVVATPASTTTTTTTTSTTTTTVGPSAAAVAPVTTNTTAQSSDPEPLPSTTSTTTTSTTIDDMTIDDTALDAEPFQTPSAVPNPVVIPSPARPPSVIPGENVPIPVPVATPTEPVPSSALAAADPLSSADDSSATATSTAPLDTEVAAETSTTSTTPAGGAGTRIRGIALDSLPMASPDDGSGGFKRLGTLMLGAAAFLLGRRVVLARRPAP